MRIRNNIMTNNYLRNLNNNLKQLGKYQNQLSTGKEVSRPSDNPVLVSKIMDLKNNISQNQQYNKNIDDTIGWVRTQDGALNNISLTLNRVRDLIVYGSNGSLSKIDRQAISDELKMKTRELVDTLNTNFDGRYVFSGQKTLTKPFSIDSNDKLSYINGNGSNKNIIREISKGVSVDLITSGSLIIETSEISNENKDLGTLLKNITDDLDNNISLSDNYLEDMDKHIDNILKVRSKIGALDNRLEAAEARNTSENLNLNSLLSKSEDIDIAEKYIGYSNAVATYQASLSVGAKILQPSLIDYLA